MNTSNQVEATQSHWKLACVLVVIFGCLSGIGLAHHEMWRDELQAWTLARDSSSLAELWQNMVTESHPMLWHTLLFVVARFTRNPVGMQCLHWLIGVVSVYLFVRFSPFTKFQKVLFCFGYYPVYEYGVISRNYSLCMLLLFLFCVLVQRRPRNYIALGGVIGLLTGAHFFDIPIAWALLAVLAWDCARSPEEREYLRHHRGAVLAGVFLFVLCQAFFAVELWRFSRQMSVEPPLRFHLSVAPEACSSMWRMFFPIPETTLDEFLWNTNLLADISDTGTRVAVFFGGLLFIVFLALLWLRSGRAALLYLLGTSGLLGLQLALGFGSMRHMGKHYLLLLASWWLAWSVAVVPGPSGWFGSLGRRTEQLASNLITVVLAIHVVAGAICYWGDIRGVFSTAKETVQYLTNQGLADKPVVISHDTFAPSISAYLGRSVYAADSGRAQGFSSCDSTFYANTNKSGADVVKRVFDLLSGATNDFVLITNYQLVFTKDGKSTVVETMDVPPDRRVIKLIKFTDAMTDERFLVYRCKRGATAPPNRP
jgi:hypothetical protein